MEKIFTALIVVLSLQAHANVDMDKLTKRWSFDCDVNLVNEDGSEYLNRKMLTELYEKEALIAVEKGLTDLQKLNLELYEKVYRRVKGKTLKWSCDAVSDMNESAAAYYQRRPHIFSKDKIKITLNSIHNSSKLLKEKGYSLHLRGVVLHEFYHHAGLDNVSASLHNEGDSGLQPGEYLDDVVYACAAQTYPQRLRFLERDLNNLVYSNSNRACNVCALASPKRGRWGTELPSGFENQSFSSCDSIQRETYHTGYLVQNVKGEWFFESVEMREISEVLQAEQERILEKHDWQMQKFDELVKGLTAPISGN